MKIYEIEQEIEDTLNRYLLCFDETWELVIPEEDFREIEKELEELQNKKSDYLEWLLKSRANNLSNISWIEAEIKRLSEMKSRFEKKVNKTELFIEKLVKPNYQWKAINYGLFSVWFKPSKKTIIENKDLIPEKYKEKVIKEEIKIPLDAIKKDIEAGIKVPWAIIQECMNLQIK